MTTRETFTVAQVILLQRLHDTGIDAESVEYGLDYLQTVDQNLEV